MSENFTQTTEQNTNNTNTVQPAYMFSDRETRRAERRAARNENGPWIVGVVLIVLGMFFILQNIGIVFLHNWWALFLLIPSLGAFSTAYSLYKRSNGRLTYAVRGSLIGGCGFGLLALAFLFNISFGVLWPLILIVAGLVMLVNFVLPE